MQIFILHLIIWFVNQGPLDRSKQVNVRIALVENAIQQKDHASVAKQLRYMMDSLRVFDPEVRLNLAHAYYNSPDTLKARQQYARLDSVADVAVSSVALQQLGALAAKRDEMEKALSLFKTTLKTDPTNDEARYNYELLKKKHQEQKEEEQKNNSKNQEPSDYAKRLKAQAEAMVRERKYGEAYQLMREGLKKDKTVSNFNDFIKRIKTVSEINQ